MEKNDGQARNMCIRCVMYEYCSEADGVTSECMACEDFEMDES